MENHATNAIQAALQGKHVFCKFLSANDTGLTGSHQAGIYIPKLSAPTLFLRAGIKGQNEEKDIKN